MKHLLQKTFALKALLLMSLLVGAVSGAWAQDETVEFSKQGYSNSDIVASYTGTYFTIEFDKGTNNNSPKYYTTGAAIRAYGGNTFTISSETKTLETIVISFGTGDGSNAITTDTETYKDGTWTGSASSVTFTIGGTSGNRRISSIAVTYEDSNPGDESVATTVTIDADGITNTDLYKGTDAGSLAAIISATDGDAIDGAIVSWSGDNDNVATIDATTGAVTLIGVGTVKFTASYAGVENEHKASSATYTLTVTDTTPIPTHIATFSTNGTTTTEEVEEGGAITFPSNIDDIEDKSFVGWVTSEITGTTDETPTFVTSAQMGQSDVTYYAVFATKVGSIESKALTITPETSGFPTSYAAAQDYTLEGKKFNILQGYINNDRLQWRAAGNSNGTGTMYNVDALSNIQSIILTYDASDSNKNFSVVVGYKKNPGNVTITPTYSGSVYTYDCSTGSYDYFVMTNGSGAGYLQSITINYQEGNMSLSGYCTTVVADSKQDAELSFSVTEVNANISEQFEAPTLNTAEGFNGTVEYTSSDESVAQIMDSETGDLMLLKEGTTTITATFAGNDDFRPDYASYTLNVTDNRIATTITQENIVLDIADIATLTQLTPVVKDAEDNIIDCTYEEFPPKVSYEIVSDESGLIGSIDNNSGEITLNAVVGTATLKASYNAFNVSNTYKPSECTFTITVESTQTIAEARAQGTGSVTTKGVVTSCSGTTAYIQDADAAICVYGSVLTVGDEIKVSGTLTTYSGLLEITNPTVTVRSQGNTITPEVMTIADINASDNQGWLVKIEDATVTAISGANTTIAQGDNTIVVRGIPDNIAVAVNDVITLTGNIGCYKNAAQIANPTDVAVKVAAPTFNPESGEVVAGAKVTISTTTEDATIYYTIDGTEPTTESTAYTEPITITETTTIKAIAVKEGMTNSTVATATYTIALPVATPTFTPAAGTYGSAQEVTISCETGGATIYYSYDNEIWTEYTEALNINESKTVYAKAEKEGLVTSYANAAYTLQIPSITFVNDATPKNLTYEAQNYDFAFEGAYTIGSFTVVVCDYEGNATSYDWFSAELNDNTVRVTLTQNEDMENSRTAFFKVTADNATSEVFSVVQNNFVPDYATLPFAYDGNATGELPDGLTQNGLGTKTYGTSPKIGFDTTDDYLILKINERPGTLTFDIKGNSFNGGTFTVQTSEDGVTYSDLETYTSLGSSTQNEEFTNLGENVRYIKWIYTEKDNGNVALGNIKLAEYTEPVIVPSITLSSYSIYATAAETEGALELSYENLTITASSDFDVQYCDSEGEEIQETPNWIVAGIAKDDGDGSYSVSYTIEANEGEARTANFKVYAMDDETNLVYSDIVTITQEAYVAPLPSITYSLASSITSGKHYLITNGNKIVMGADKGNNRNAVEVNMSDSKLSVTDEAVQEVVICGPDANGYYTLYADGYLYAASSSSNYLKTQATADANGLWSIVIDEYGVATIQAKGSNSRNLMRYNLGSKLFSCYGSGQNDIYLYERDDEEAPEASYSRATSVDNWGTICLPNTATITGAKLYSIEGVDSKDAPSVIYLNEYKGTAVAGTPYLFQATENAIHAYYTGDAAEEALNNNGLFGSFERMPVETGNYVLSNNQIVYCGENCFIGANRAYIDMSLVPEYEETGEAGVKMLYLNDITTGINGIDANGEGAVIYDLSGRRLSKAQKGLYIVNGKKVSVK